MNLKKKVLKALLCLALLLPLVSIVAGEVQVQAAACTGLQSLIDNTPSGGTLKLTEGCVYRENAVINHPISIIGGDVQIKGSDVWTDWTSRADGKWVSVLTVPDFKPANMTCDNGEGDRCKWREQVFIDGESLYQIPKGKIPASGQFALDNSKHIVLADDPANHQVEVTTRTSWLTGTADNVTIDHLIFRHAANDRGSGGVDANGNNWKVENSSLGYAHAANITVSKVTGSYLLNNEYFGAGQVGIAGNQGTFVIEGGRVHHNNIEGTKPGWAGGGIKISNPVNITITGVEVDHNQDNGIWTDVPNTPQSVIISNNIVHHNPGDGIRVEVTVNAAVYGNIIYENGWPRGKAGIALNASSDSVVHHNILAWNYNGISVRNPLRTDVHPDEESYDYVSNVNVHHNTILDQDIPGEAGRYSLAWIQAWDGGNIYNSIAANYGHQNAYYYTSPESEITRFRWIGSFGRLADFNTSPGEKKGYYLNEKEKNEVIAKYRLPAQSEAH